VVDAANAEPVGLYFAGGTDLAGVSQAVASPAGDVLSELGAQAGSGTSYSYVGGADHQVSCLNYGDSTAVAAQARTLSDAESTRAQQALADARALVNPAVGILGVGAGKSSDHPGEGAVLLYVDETMSVNAPATVNGVRTLVVPTNARAVAFGSAPQSPIEARSITTLPSSVLGPAMAVKQQVARNLMRDNPAFFGIGVGQSLDNPKEAALVIYVDRKQLPAQLPATVNGLRARYIVMDRLHVTRSFATPIRSKLYCVPRASTGQAAGFDQMVIFRPRNLKLY
jgi:hypothetical protein